MNIRFGHGEKGLFLYIIGLMPFMLILYINKIAVFREGEMIPFWYNLLILFGMFLGFMGILWILIHNKKYAADVIMDEARPEEVKLFRITRDGIILTRFAPKGSFGTIETLAYGDPVDFNDSGEFPLRTLDGSPAVIVYDMLNEVINPKRSIARRFMKRSVISGVDGYDQWKKKTKMLKEKIKNV